MSGRDSANPEGGFGVIADYMIGGNKVQKLTLDDVADFVWGFGCEFFLETEKGNFVWSDPDYGGDNTIRKFNGNYKDWCKKSQIPYGRHKGRHVIRDYCCEDGEPTIVD